MTIYSQSSNKKIGSFGVNPQTGLYSFSNPLLTLGAKDDSKHGVKREISLQFEALAAQPNPNQNSLYGVGWSIEGLSRYVNQQTIKLSNGQQFAYAGLSSDKTLVFHDQKTQDFYVLFDSDNNEYRVFHQDGVIEVLIETITSTAKTYCLWQLIFPNGEIYTFKYQNVQSEYVLWKVTDAQDTTLLELQHDGGFLSTIKIKYDNDTYALIFTNITTSDGCSLLNRISRPTTEDGIIEWVNFNYSNSNGFQVIDQVTYPEGAKETIIYEVGGHLYISNGNTIHTPRVAQYIYSPGADQPEMSEICDYPEDGHNYLGYPNDYGWSNPEDNIYRWGKASSYEYSVKITSAKGTENETINTYYYNAFHLKTRETVEKKGCTIETTYHYVFEESENLDKTFIEQPNNLLFPTKITKTFIEGEKTKSYSIEMETDEYGNQLRKIDLSGVIETSAYYDIEGESQNCPPDPFGRFKRFIKEHKVISSDQTLVKQRLFFYSNLQPLSAATNFLNAVVKVAKIEIGDSITTSLLAELSYLNAPDSLFTHNTIKKATLSIYQEDGTPLPTKCDFTHTYDKGLLTEQRAIAGYDNTSFSTSETRSVYTNVVFKQVNRYGIVNEAIYDIRNRIVTNKWAVGTDCEQVVSYEYETFNAETQSPQAIKTDSTGLKSRIIYDGGGQIVAADKQDKAGIYRRILIQKYNNLGQQISQTQIDSYPNGDEFSSVTTTMRYDGWGQLCESQTDDGIIEVITNDPFELKQTKQLIRRDNSEEPAQVTASLAKEATTYNLFKLPELIHLESATISGIQTEMYYDGLGRKQKIITALGHQVSVENYDIFDRIQKIKNPSGQIIDVLYAEFSPKQLITKLQMDEGGSLSLLGEQQFDGIERIISKSVTDIKTLYSYEGSNELPNQIVTSAGNSIKLEFNPALKNQPTSIASWRGTENLPENPETLNTFSYATKIDARPLGRLTTADGANATYNFDYLPSGTIYKITQSVDNVSTATTTYNEQTLFGANISTTVDIGEEKIVLKYTYDSFGRLLTTTQNDIVVAISYDQFGRIDKEEITSEGTTRQLTELIWDDLNREQSRKITAFVASEQQVYQLDFSYDSENKLTERRTSVNDVLKLQEQFSYDVSNHLIAYQVADGYDAAFLPQNDQRLAIIGEEFVFDSFHNITSVTTKFDGGEVDTTTWEYEKAELRRPSKISHSLTSHFPAEVSFEYDQDGNLTNIRSNTGEDQHQFTYSVTGRLLGYSNSNGLDERFKYDVFERILSSNSGVKYYLGNNVIAEQGTNGEYVEFVRNGKRIIGEKLAASTQFIGSDQFLSAVLVHNSEELKHQTYAPYGSVSTKSRTGFMGEIKPANMPFYSPGNGTRVYLPQYGIFSTMDSMSPFAGGGINPYLYCGGNPINLIDPSGHLSSKADLGLNIFAFIVDAIELALTAAAVVASAGLAAPAALGIVSTVFGLTSSTLGIAADSMSIKDENQDTDRSQTISRLGVASSAFGVASSVTGSIENVVGSFTGSIESVVGSFTGSKASRSLAKAGKHLDNATDIPDRPQHSAKKKFARDLAQLNSKEGTTYYKKAFDALDAQSTKRQVGKAFISTATGIDFDAISKVVNVNNSIVKRSLNGAWAATQIGAFAAGLAMFSNSTWTVDDGTDSEEMASNSMNNYVVQMVNDKYPIG